jgi:hypothetical protein
MKGRETRKLKKIFVGVIEKSFSNDETSNINIFNNAKEFLMMEGKTADINI